MRLRTIAILLLLAITAALFFPTIMPSSSVFYLSLLFMAIAFVFAYRKGRKGGELEYLRLAFGRSEIPKLLAWGAAALVASGIASAAITLALSYFGLLDTQKVQLKLLSLPLPALVAAFTLAPLAEEMLFRGLVFRKVSEFRIAGGKPAGELAGALSSSIIFAALHASYGSLAELAVAFAIGMVFCWFVKRTKSLFPSILAHASFNFLSILFTVWFP